MKISSKKITIFVAIISVALIGLVFLQAKLLKTALKSEEETFRTDVVAALNKVVSELSSNEARHAILKIDFGDSLTSLDKKIIKSEVIVTNDQDTVFVEHMISKFGGRSNFFLKDSLLHGKMKIIQSDSLATFEKELFIDESVAYSYFYSSDGDSISFTENLFGKDSAKIMLIWSAIQQLDVREMIPLEIRLDKEEMDSSISLALRESGIDLDFSFGVLNRLENDVMLIDSLVYKEKLLASPYKARLFPYELAHVPNFLAVYFPDKQFFIYNRLIGVIIPTVLFLVIIIFCFIYSIRIIIGQQNLALRLKDFINNMTHEFKTPISTIQLAAEAISKDEVISDKSKLAKFNDMILNENQRMKNQVEKILQIATLEDGDYDLKLEQLDLHEIIKNAIDMFGIKVASTGGNIVTALSATKTTVNADKVHLTNIIHNLLDNAIKYSGDSRTITVSTEDKNGRFIISIRDDGIGIDPNDLKHVFDKYFRVSQGDIHDVKGFGLGLSYVKMMTEVHGGSASIKSALGKGTEVLIELPLADE